MKPLTKAYIGLGSNLADPVKQMQRAIELIKRLPNSDFYQSSSFYSTSPVGPVAQNDFINAVVSIGTALSAHDLLQQCLQIEMQLGRHRHERWGPRIIDCDLLWIQDVTCCTPELTLPHPEMMNRLFVLVPLAEIDPAFMCENDVGIHQQIQHLKQHTDQIIQVYLPEESRIIS